MLINYSGAVRTPRGIRATSIPERAQSALPGAVMKEHRLNMR